MRRDQRTEHRERDWQCRLLRILERALLLAQANYSVEFAQGTEISERIIFPFAPSESNGIEDARFARFTDDDGHATYYATYTAFDGCRTGSGTVSLSGSTLTFGAGLTGRRYEGSRTVIDGRTEVRAYF